MEPITPTVEEIVKTMLWPSLFVLLGWAALVLGTLARIAWKDKGLNMRVPLPERDEKFEKWRHTFKLEAKR